MTALVALVVLILGCITPLVGQGSDASGHPVSEFRLSSSIFRHIEKVIEVAPGVLVVLDADRPFWIPERKLYTINVKANQVKELKLSLAQGASPILLIDIATSGSPNEFLVSDIGGHRLFRFDLNGKQMWSKWLQNPGIAPHGITMSGDLKSVNVGACKPVKYFVDDGCTLLHEYSLPDGNYIGGTIETDPIAVQNKLLALETYRLDSIERKGLLFADSAVRKLFVRDASGKKIRTFDIKSNILKPIPLQNPAAGVPNWSSQYTMMAVLSTKSGHTAVFRGPKPMEDLVFVVNPLTGKQIVTDRTVAGNVVGRSLDRKYLFICRREPGSLILSATVIQ